MFILISVPSTCSSANCYLCVFTNALDDVLRWEMHALVTHDDALVYFSLQAISVRDNDNQSLTVDCLAVHIGGITLCILITMVEFQIQL